MIIDHLIKFHDNLYLKTFDGNSYSYRDLCDLIIEYQNHMRAFDKPEIIALIGDFNHQAIAFLLANFNSPHTIFPVIDERHLEDIKPTLIADIRKEKLKLNKDHSSSDNSCEIVNMAKIGFLTSGTTGKPKIINHEMNKIWARASTLNKLQNALLYLKFDHMGGINTLFTVIKSGKMAISLKDRFPQSVLETIVKFSVELLPATPTLLSYIINSGQLNKLKNSALKKVSVGTEPLDQEIIKTFLNELPEIKLVQAYGLTEVGVFKISTHPKNPLYFKFIEENLKTKIENSILFLRINDQEWFNTNDIVEVMNKEDESDNEDYLRIMARKSDLINLGGEKFYPQEVESVLLKMPQTISAKAYTYHHELFGAILGAEILVNQDFHYNLDQIKKHCLSFLPLVKVPVSIEIKTLKDDLPIKKSRI